MIQIEIERDQAMADWKVGAVAMAGQWLWKPEVERTSDHGHGNVGVP